MAARQLAHAQTHLEMERRRANNAEARERQLQTRLPAIESALGSGLQKAAVAETLSMLKVPGIVRACLL
jgi:hypothetical protein